MTFWGWVFMMGSAAFVWSLVGYCYYKVLTGPAPSPEAPDDTTAT